MIFAMLIMAAMTTKAESTDDNAPVYVFVGNFEYVEPSAASQVGLALLGLMGKDPEIWVQDKTLIPIIQEGIKAGLGRTGRFVLMDGTPTAEVIGSLDGDAIYVDGTITRSEMDSGEGIIGAEFQAAATFHVNIKDLKTGNVTKSDKLRAISSFYKDNDSATKEALISAISGVTAYYCTALYPVSGRVLEKGVEHNGKIRNKECYISLGENYKLCKGQSFAAYTFQDGQRSKKSIAKFKVKEVMGDDISLCTITSGNSALEKALGKDLEVVVVTNCTNK